MNQPSLTEYFLFLLGTTLIAFPFKVTFPGLNTMLKLSFGNRRPQDPYSVLNVTFPGLTGFVAENQRKV